ncbi:MAG: ABC transporter permease, partial [Acidimicrobiales bacterium]|nr:ABC transporter permease [Acidimicrobiales bacterium]
MLYALARRLPHLVAVLFIVSVATFLLVDLTPGDPAAAILGDAAPAEEYAKVRTELGLDDPIHERYVRWLGDLVQGDLGRKLVPPIEDVSAQLTRRFPVTLEIAFLALLLSLAISVPLGMWSAFRAGAGFDRAAGGLTFGLISVPPFLGALILIFFFVFHTAFPRYLVLAGGLCWALWLGFTGVQRYREDPSDPARGRALATRTVVALALAGLTVYVTNK